MADDGEWHTVTSNKHTAAATPSNNNAQHSKGRRKSRHKITTTPKSNSAVKQQQQQQQQSTITHNNKTKEKKLEISNPFHAVEEDDSDEEEDDGQVDPIDLPVPPYHTTIVVSCPLDDCESSAPFLDTTALVKHLKEDHNLAFKNLHHMYMALDSYLARWAKELAGKPITEFGQPDKTEKGGKCIGLYIECFWMDY